MPFGLRTLDLVVICTGNAEGKQKRLSSWSDYTSQEVEGTAWTQDYGKEMMKF